MPAGCTGVTGVRPMRVRGWSLLLQSTRTTLGLIRFGMLQVVRLGRFFMLSVPSEFTTMAGRRTRKAVHDEATPRCRTAHT